MILNTKSIMRKWIYLKSDNLADALALVTILKDTEEHFCIVRQSHSSFLFKELPNVTIDFYKKGDDLIEINPILESSWTKKCIYLSKILGLEVKDKYEPHNDFKTSDLVQESLLQKKYGLLYLFPTLQWNIDLILIDQMVRKFEQQQLELVSGGSHIMPCINGTKDYRQILDIGMIGKLKDNISFIITSETFMSTIGEAFGIKVFVLSYNDGLRLNNHPVNDSNQMVNFIMSNI